MNLKKPSLLRRSISGAALLVLAACSNVAQAATYTMFRDPGCGCCLNWAGHVEDGMNTKVASVDSNDMAAIKTARGVPQELWSCHTMEVDGYIIEGHVPAEAVAKLCANGPPALPASRFRECLWDRPAWRPETGSSLTTSSPLAQPDRASSRPFRKGVKPLHASA